MDSFFSAEALISPVFLSNSLLNSFAIECKSLIDALYKTLRCFVQVLF